MATFTATTGTDTFTGTGTNNDTFLVTATSQVVAADTFNGAGGTDTIQIGAVGAGVSVNLSSAATNGTQGFLSIEGLSFANTSGTSTVTLSSAQFGSTLISNTLTVTGTSSTQNVWVNVASGATFTAASWTFPTWTSGTD